MLTLALTVASMMAATQLPPLPLADTARMTVASRSATVDKTPPAPTVADHLEAARRALAAGEFDVARREFVIAAALDRDAGNVPVEAMFGLANVLYSSSYNREAAITMTKLAEEAGAIRDYNTEARALVDAIWLNLDAGQRMQAKLGGARLTQLIKDKVLSDDTMRLINSRFRS